MRDVVIGHSSAFQRLVVGVIVIRLGILEDDIPRVYQPRNISKTAEGDVDD